MLKLELEFSKKLPYDDTCTYIHNNNALAELMNLMIIAYMY